MEKSTKIGKTIYIDKDLSDKIQEVADKRGFSYNTILQQILLKTDWNKIEKDMF